MFDGFMKPKFYNKCKTALKLTKTRLDAVNKKRSAIEKYLKKDIVDLLKNGLDYNAYGRAEGLLIEQNMSCCYGFIDQFCGAITSRLSVMQKEKDCPEECKEAVPSLMFAAARFADLPELRELRSLFAEKYGTSLENFVNKEFVGRLKAGPPTKDVKVQLLRDVAAEFSLQWDSKSLEQKLFAPPATVQGSTCAPTVEIQDDSDRWKRREKRDFVAERKTEAVVGSKSLHEEPKRDEKSSSFHRSKEANDVDVKLSSGVKRDEDETNHSRKPSYRNIPPPYIKSNPEKEKNIVAEENKAPENESAQEVKAKPRSVRQRRLKLPPGQAGVDDEERVIDGLLLQYSKKQPSSPYDPSNGSKGSLKPPPHSLEGNLSHSRRNKNGKPELGVPPTRTASLPSEATSPTDSSGTERGHCRSNSYQNEMFPGHVHPNLPDYEDLASRLAALRGR